MKISLLSWSDICQKCVNLRNSLEDIRKALKEIKLSKRYSSLDDKRPVYLRKYLVQVENLNRLTEGHSLVTCKDKHKGCDMEELQQLCERVLSAMEQWHLRTIHELHEAHAQEVLMLKQEKEQALEDQLDTATRQLAKVQQHILKLERSLQISAFAELMDRFRWKELY